MDMDYDRKFEEMKGYIPFLENMIKRLESTGAIENPRQAQLDKIRSLRDLLLDKKKRMKMENLLKCEQLLVNLYVKVEQRDSLPGIKKDSVHLEKENPESSAANSKSGLEIVRNKLKTVVGVVCDNPETLPEIARANESEVSCSLSGKEPALFQRRSNKASISPPKDSPNKRLEKSSPHSSNSRRGYTRVLLSPESDKNRWSSTECPSDQVLYSRKSPHRSPRKRSPLHHNKDKKKSSKQGLSSCKSKDLNITLKVPEESVKSLNTKDILSRIINCSDSDVDIDTLRELRKQILGELKQTETNDDIADLILKSYKNTKKKIGKAKEVEEGELSDSESEAIDSIYGSLIVVEKDRKSLKSSEVRPTSDGENQSCKIQISLVINATADNKVDPDRIKIHDKVTDETEFEMYNNEDNKSFKLTPNEDETSCKVPLDEPQTKSNDSVVIIDDEENVSTIDNDTSKISENTDIITKDAYVSNTSVSEKETNIIEKNTKINEKDKKVIEKNANVSKKDARLIKNVTSEIPETKNINISPESLNNSDRKTESSKIGNENKTNIANIVEIPFKSNFYKPLEHDLASKEGFNNNSDESVSKGNFEKSSCQGMFSKKEEETIEIPLLNLESDPPIKPAKEDVMSEIDILQALKNEILSDTISIPGTDIATPALHLPKLIKVANAQEIKPKKRRSIESYKEKAISKPRFVKEPLIDDLSKKQSLKLTEKDSERFNFPAKLPLLSSDEDEDEEIDKSSATLEDIYDNIAPKSPDDETSTDIEKTIPVIIPIDPIKKLPTGSAKAGVDMRTMVPNMSSDVINHIPSLSDIDAMKKENKTGEKGPLTDPRLKRDANPSVSSILNIHSTNPDRTPILASPYRNIIPNMTPSMTPNAKSYEMTPSYQSFETCENSNRRHVCASTLLNQEAHDQREISVNRELSPWRKSDKVVEENKRFEPLYTDGNQPKRDNLSRRGSVQRDDIDSKSNYSDLSPNYELYPYRNRHETYENNYSFNRSDEFGRSDIAQTPVRTFGRSECPSTPKYQFGRSYCPTTPIHPFGRSDCPSTPSLSFGRSDCPTTPLHPFGRLEVQSAMKSQFERSECPTTPVHHFGRSETPLTPVHSFGRSDYSKSHLSSNPRFVKDPRLNRSQDYDSSNRKHYDGGRTHSYERDRNISKYKWDARGNSYKPDFNQRSHDNSEPYRYFPREQSVGRNKSHPNNLNRDITNSREYRDGVKSRFDLRRDRNTSKSTEDVRIKRSYHRDRIGESITSPHEFSRFSKSLSHFKRYNTSDNRLSVQAHAGRSFTIDTKINRSFQEIITKGNTLLSNDMYSRRQRAASVGRIIIRESSVDNNLSSVVQRNRNANFRRAQSVGRDVAKYKSENSLKDMEAQFESFKANLEERKPLNYNDSKPNDYDRQGTYLPKKNTRDPRSRRERYDNSNKNEDSREKTSHGIVYSNDNIAKGIVLRASTGVKNYKIPKIKRPVEETDETTTEIVGKDKNAEEKESTTASVKNVLTTTVKESVETVVKADSKISNEVLDKKIVSDGDGDENIQRVTKSSKKFSVKSYDEEEYKIKPNKNRKAIIQDSDSDTMDSIKSENKKNSSPKKQKSDENVYKSDAKIQDHVFEKVLSEDTNQKSNVIDILPTDTNKQNISTDSTTNKECTLTNKSQTSTPEKNNNTKQSDGLNSSFSLDDSELFPDNIGSDSVIENINSLIADLDNNLDSEKPIENIDHATISMENMTVNIMEDKSNSSQTNENEIINDINEFIKNHLSKEEKNVPQNLNLNKTISESFTSISNLNPKNPVTEMINTDKGNNVVKVTQTKKSEKGSNKVVDRLNDGDISTSMEENCVENCTNAVVSTTEDKQKSESIDICQKNDVVNLEKRIDNCSTLDSTINTHETQIDNFNDKKLLQSIENNHTEINSDVTSTHDSIEKEAIRINDTDSQQKENLLFSILQKSKIRELLHMLDDKSSDTEKIKRKLEKLSEIMSDDEDTDSVEPDKNETKNDKNAILIVNDLTTTNLTCESNTFPEDTNDKKEQSQPNELTNKVDEANLNTNECDNLVNEGNSDDVSSAGMVQTGKDQTTTKLSYETIKTSEEINYRKEQLTTTANELTKTINTTNDNTTEQHDFIATVKSNNINNTGNEDNNDNTGNDDNIADDEANKILKDVPNVEKHSPVITTKKKITKKTRKKGVKNRISGTVTGKPKTNNKRSRELMRLQDDIREMFISDDVLNVTGIRMCRLAKLVEDNGQTQKDSQDSDNVLITGKVAGEEQSSAEKTVKKKSGPKPKVKPSDKAVFDNTEKAKSLPKYKPGPKSKTKIPFENPDPYAFETDLNVGTHSIKEIEKSLNNSSDSESDSSSIKSRGSSEHVIEIKKKKCSWKAGVIKPKNRKKKDIKQTETTLDTAKVALVNEQVTIPDLNCFTDKLYCFNKNVVDYPCRLCSYSGLDIVHHYKKEHPHTEIPLSRMNPEIAKEAIEQCENINFKEISKMPTEKYVCRFCFKEISRKKASLEAFFWHIVSVHTGEYKNPCSECVNDRKCPFNLDIPPPPKDVKGQQLIGFICGKCNFTQISVENLKSHVIDRHNDEETEVFTINLAVMTKKTFSSLLKGCNLFERPRVLRSSRSYQSLASDDLSDVTESDRIDSVRRSSLSLSSDSKNERVNIKSKLAFENDDIISDNSVSYISKSMDVTNETINSEQEDNEEDNDESASHADEVFDELPPEKNRNSALDKSIESENATLGDVVTLPHFKIQYTETGAREYVCCINGNDRHYKTAMTISMKKHVQLNHKENWDGFCFICKLIVTTQGNHSFKDCFQHFIEKHMEEFPVLENLVTETTFENEAPTTSNQEVAGAKSLTKNFINVHPIYELLPQPDETQSTPEDSTSMPKIQSVVSLGSPSVDQPLPSPTYPKTTLDTAKVALVNEQVTIPDLNCFTDKLYCFNKNVVDYPCRLCSYSGLDIVHHYKKEHPHTEIPLSRMNPEIAKEAIEQCENINFKEISKMPTEKYVCRFCFKEISRKKASLEAFFWHIVSVHTGEYKNPCSECVNDRKCPFNLDIPPPPKDVKGQQLIGFICGKCNFTQISVKNLKSHVIDRHNDEETEVFTINLAVMTKKTFSSLLKGCNLFERPRVLRSSRSYQSLASDDLSDVTESDRNSDIDSVRRSSLSLSSDSKNERVNIKSKLAFENDDIISDNSVSYISKSMDVTNETINSEQEDNEEDNDESASHADEVFDELPPEKNRNSALDKSIESENATLGDVVTLPHFKIQYTETGAREYVCCINGNDRHYKTAMTISMKKHVQLNHKENWDGFCFICKLIVTTQGNHSFKDCFQHFIEKHMEEFPVLENLVTETTFENEAPTTSNQEVAGAKSLTKNFINVHPIYELLPQPDETQSTPEDSTSMPKIQSVVSLGSPSVDQPLLSPTYPKPCERTEAPKAYKYEEWQAVVMSNKHRIVLESMMPRSKLIHIFKCAGRFCSFSTDSAEDALLHASTHQRVGGEGALDCAYCDFDTTSNAIDLVMHVFKKHGSCQYMCGLCFYRAAASQLVNAHFVRAHPESAMVSVLRTTAAPKPCNEDEAKDLLPRKDAVKFYSCAHRNPDNSICKFRAYISNEFYEHLQQRHPDLPHGCNICSYSSEDPNELVQHMKTHDIMLYQCTWCVHGADQESELLAHCSAKHPDRQPQAYLRIITSKDADLRMLPLAQLNISKVPTEELAPTVNHENPVREAERSIELEKLIGPTMLMIAGSAPSHGEPEQDRVGSTGPLNMLTPATHVSAPNLRMLLTESSCPAFGTQSRPVTPLRPVTPVQEPPTTEAVTPVLKMEPQEPTPEKAPSNSDIIYSLDSDDEGAGIIDLSQEEEPLAKPTQAAPPVETTAPNTVQAVDTTQPIPDEMYKCDRCYIFFADLNSLQDHILTCYSYLKSVSKCPICNFKHDNQEMLLEHIKTCISKKFTRVSTESIKRAKRYKCGICRCVSTALVYLKAHLRHQHSINKIRTELEVVDTVAVFTVVEQVPKPKGKRKPSATAVSKQKGYGPLEIDQLSINPILDELVFCNLCGFTTKVRLNMVRHLQRHAEQQPVAKTAPVNPVPHLETNEKHFDKMLNLASSSLVNRPDKASKGDGGPRAAQHIPPDAAARYPKYVPERQRHACGAAGCSYISLDEDMLKCHWETLHANSSDYRCVHCPPYQQLDRSRPLTAARIIAHLKMHDANLYACSLCSYYHYKRNIVEKHLAEVHKGGRALVVRGEGAAPAPGPSAAAPAAPTMDLKPWQCGLCQFKSMIRQEVVEHCAKTHQSKMQYFARARSYCPFRTSAAENVIKHQATSHAEKQPEIFYYYYKEGDLPDEPDGTPRWAKQQQKAPKATEIKTEIGDSTIASSQLKTAGPLSTKVAPISVDLNMVKIEVDTDSSDRVTSTEDLCNKYGSFCGPNGLKFKCPLCKVVTEDKEEVMQSHLYEELRYRKWGCRICSYKGFHKKGLDEHMIGEHGTNAEPLELPLDVNVESWVDQLLKHQLDLIEKSRDNLAEQKNQFESSKAQPSTSRAPPREQIALDSTTKQSMKELEETFGQFGAPKNDCYCCPKCDFETREESAIRDHLETELNKIRWSCRRCSEKFQNCHEAHFHCKSVHLGQSSHPNEVVRSPALRSAWVAAVIRMQSNSISSTTGKTGVAGSGDSSIADRPARAHSPDVSKNSLLVVEFEQKVPTLEGAAPSRKRPAPVAGANDSDEERLVIDESLEATPLTSAKKPRGTDKCPYCPVITRTHQRLGHILKHYNLQSLSCPYCNHTNSRKKAVVSHKTKIPEVPPWQHLNVDTLTKTCPVTSPREATWSVKVSRLEQKIGPIADVRMNAASPVQKRKIDDSTIMPPPKRVARKSTLE